MVYQEGDFYQNLRSKMKDWLSTKEGSSHKWADYLMFAPDLLHLLCKLTIDEDVPVKERAKLAAAIAYFISPIDLVPEAIVGVIGYTDDIVLAAYVLNSIINNTKLEIVERHWAGDEDVLHVIQKILRVADEMIGSGLFKRLKKTVK
jgi:uncharacterized membrane protein YkvA (DUF1232 family)